MFLQLQHTVPGGDQSGVDDNTQPSNLQPVVVLLETLDKTR